MTRPFRFGVNLMSVTTRDEWQRKCRRAEELGFDVVLAPDHLGAPAPFPTLIAAADATERPRLGTFVLNAGFWNPALLAREVATTDNLTGGRLELGLGTGYVKAEHDDADLPWGSPGERMRHLTRTIEELNRLLGDPAHTPRPVQTPRPPLLVAGNGHRMMRLVARHADIAAFTGGRQAPGKPEGVLELFSAEEMDTRLAAFKEHSAGREHPAELNILIQRVRATDDRRAMAREVAARDVGLDVDQLLEAPTMLFGTVLQMVEQLRGHRERFGFSYVCVLEPSMEEFGAVIEHLKGH